MGSQRLRPRQDSSAAPPQDPSPTDSNPLPPSNTSPPNADPTTSPPDTGVSDTGTSQPSPTPTKSNTGQTSPTNGGSNTGQSPTNGGSNGGQNSGSPPPAPTGAGSGHTNDPEGGLVTTNGQTLSIAGGVTVAVSQIITEHNGQITTVTVPIATLSPTSALTTFQRDGIIAGSVVGGFVIGMIVIAFLFWRRRRIRQQEKADSEVPRPRRLLHSDGPLDLTEAGSTNPYMTTAWQPQMAQYEAVDSGSPFAMGDPISSPRMSRARTSVSGSIFQEDVWPPPGEEYLGTLGGGNQAGAGLAPPSRTSLDTQGLGESGSPTRPFLPYDPNAPMQPPSPIPILTSFSTQGIRPSTPTSLVSSPISYASGSRLIPSAAAAAKARESTSESSRVRYRSSWLGPTSGPHSAYSESEYGPAGGGGGGSSTLSQVDQAESSPAPPLIDSNSASRAGTGSSGTTSDRGGFNEAINARLNPMGLGGGPSPGPTPLDNEIPPLYSMIRRDTDLSLEGGTTPGRST